METRRAVAGKAGDLIGPLVRLAFQDPLFHLPSQLRFDPFDQLLNAIHRHRRAFEFVEPQLQLSAESLGKSIHKSTSLVHG